MQKYIIALLFVFLVTHLYAQPGDMPMNQEPGKCYAKCQLPDLYEEEEEIFKIYTGMNTGVALDSVYFRINDEGNWIYVGFENDLNAAQVELKGDFEKIVFLVNEEGMTDYVEETIAYKRLIKEGGLEWKEVVCGDKLGPDLFINVQLALMEKGYLEKEKPVTILTKEARAALYKYQQAYGLPMGQMDVETLESLGL